MFSWEFSNNTNLSVFFYIGFMAKSMVADRPKRAANTKPNATEALLRSQKIDRNKNIQPKEKMLQILKTLKTPQQQGRNDYLIDL